MYQRNNGAELLRLPTFPLRTGGRRAALQQPGAISMS